MDAESRAWFETRRKVRARWSLLNEALRIEVAIPNADELARIEVRVTDMRACLDELDATCAKLRERV